MTEWFLEGRRVQAVAHLDPSTGAAAPVGTPNDPQHVRGIGFDLVASPTVTNGAYSAGDIMGGLIEFTAGRTVGDVVVLQEVQVAFKAAVQPNLRVVVLTADPTATTKTDNAAYSLAAADAFKVRRTLSLSGYNTHGTPKTVSLGNLAIPIRLGGATDKLYLLVVDDSGVTLTSTSDMQVRIAGVY
jgi:hypothetical protein